MHHCLKKDVASKDGSLLGNPKWWVENIAHDHYSLPLLTYGLCMDDMNGCMDASMDASNDHMITGNAFYPMTSVEISGERWCWEMCDFPTPSDPHLYGS